MTEALAVWLLIFGFDDSGKARSRYALPMPSMEACLQATAAAKIDGAKSGDAQTVVLTICATGNPKDRSTCYASSDMVMAEAWPCELREHGTKP